MSESGKTQGDKFRQAAKDLEADDSPEAFTRRLEELIKPENLPDGHPDKPEKKKGDPKAAHQEN